MIDSAMAGLTVRQGERVATPVVGVPDMEAVVIAEHTAAKCCGWWRRLFHRSSLATVGVAGQEAAFAHRKIVPNIEVAVAPPVQAVAPMEISTATVGVIGQQAVLLHGEIASNIEAAVPMEMPVASRLKSCLKQPASSSLSVDGRLKKKVTGLEDPRVRVMVMDNTESISSLARQIERRILLEEHSRPGGQKLLVREKFMLNLPIVPRPESKDEDSEEVKREAASLPEKEAPDREQSAYNQRKSYSDCPTRRQKEKIQYVRRMVKALDQQVAALSDEMKKEQATVLLNSWKVELNSVMEPFAAVAAVRAGTVRAGRVVRESREAQLEAQKRAQQLALANLDR
jgi:hypothetical protein